MKPLSDFATEVLARLNKTDSATAGELRRRGENRLGVSSALRALERRGLAGSFCHPRDSQWSATYWYAVKQNSPK